MNSDEVNEAAERLRMADMYGIDIAALLATDGIDQQLPQDLVTIMRAYHAEHPVNDEAFDDADPYALAEHARPMSDEVKQAMGRRPDVLDDTYRFVCEWYETEAIRRCIASDWRQVRDAGSLPKIPVDVQSQEFADWLCTQYRLAMMKGIDLAREAMQKRLAEHPADDGEAITLEWLWSLGVKFGWQLGKGPSGIDRIGDLSLSRPVWIETRGQLRRLCAALGIELKHPTASDQETGK